MYSGIKIKDLAQCFRSGEMNPDDKSRNIMKQIFDLFEFKDEKESIWIKVPAGPIEDWSSYSDFEEINCDNDLSEEEKQKEKESLIKYFKDCYPEDYVYMCISLANVPNYGYQAFWIDRNMIFEERPEQFCGNWDNYSELFESLLFYIKQSLELIKNNKMQELLDEIPLRKHFAVISVKDYFNLNSDEKEFYLEHLAPEDVDYFLSNASQQTEPKAVPYPVTVLTYLKACEIIYDALGEKELITTNRYYDQEGNKLPLPSIYSRMADGRDDGLLELDMNSEDDYRSWLKTSHGGHPFEILPSMSISNSIHLYMKETGEFVLSGKSDIRREDIVVAFNVLHQAGYNVSVLDIETIANRLKYEGYIGIVPEGLLSFYDSSYLFPGLNISFFINLNKEDEEAYAPYVLHKWLAYDDVRGGDLKCLINQKK